MKKKANISIFVPHAGCTNACVFCNQRAISNTLKLPGAEDIDAAVRDALSNENLVKEQTEIAFFGGSFTAIEPDRLRFYLETATELILKHGFKGIRFSTRPDCINEQIMELLRSYPVTAIELGAQSFDDDVLGLTCRGHTEQDIAAAAQQIKKAGYELVLQLMTGLPGDTDEGALRTLEKAIALSPDGVRIYPCLVIKGTQLERLYRQGSYEPQTLESAVQLCKKMVQRLEGTGIKLLKLGLHASEAFGAQGELVAGPYHPAFRELVFSELYYDEIIRQIKDCSGDVLRIACNPTDRSAVTGQNKSNIKRLAEGRGFSRVEIVEDAGLEKGKILAVCG